MCAYCYKPAFSFFTARLQQVTYGGFAVNEVKTSISVTFGRLAVSDFELASVISVSDFELAINVIVLLIYCDVRFCILVHFRCGTFEKCRCRFCHMYYELYWFWCILEEMFLVI